MKCILCRNEITDKSNIIQGVLWKGDFMIDRVGKLEDYIEIAICHSCRERIRETIKGKIDSNPIIRMAFKKYLRLVGDDILNFLKE